MHGGPGADKVDGMLGFDRLYGDVGPDYVTDWDNNENGYDAGDYLYGGGGKDTLDAQTELQRLLSRREA